MPHFSRRTLLVAGLATAPVLLPGCGGGIFSSDESSGGSGAVAGASPEAPPAAAPSPVAPSPVAPAPSPTPAPTPPAPSASPVWDIRQTLAFVAGAPSTLDLSITLPDGVSRGGNFGLANNSASLPTTIALASNGLLSIGAGASVGATSGVLFTYNEP